MPEEKPQTGRTDPGHEATQPRAVSTTIVGGQPPRRRSVTVQVPVGLEKVLYLAATDPSFKEELLQSREAALQARGIRLRSSEQAMLRMTQDDQLRAAIAALDVSPESVLRRQFMRQVAACAAAVAAAGSAGGCGDDSDARVDTSPSGPDSGGILPDLSYMGEGGTGEGVTTDSPGPPDVVPCEAPLPGGDMGILPD